MVRPAGDDQTNQSAGLNRNSQMNLSSHHHQSPSSSSSSSSNSVQNNYFMKSASLTHYIPNMEWSWVFNIYFLNKINFKGLIDFKTRSNLK